MIRRISIVLAAAALALACRAPEPRTPEEKKAKGDQILRQMSDLVSAGKVKIFSFTAEEVSEKVEAGGKKALVKVVRHVTVRRPDGFTFTTEGGHGAKFWYDGKKATIVAEDKKVWARGPVPDDLDKMLDYSAAVYDMQLPWADLLYSSPYDALVDADTTGGWVGEETIEGKECDRLSYQNPVVDWEIWVTREHRPKQLHITYKQDPGQPVTRVLFKDLNVSPSVTEETFTAKVPDGYTRIRLARRDSDLAPVEDDAAEASPAASKAPTPPAR
jgi:hypothetical protein